MPQITIDLSDEAYALLAQRAEKKGQSPEEHLTFLAEWPPPLRQLISYLEEQTNSINGFMRTLLLDVGGTLFSHSERMEMYGIIQKAAQGIDGLMALGVMPLILREKPFSLFHAERIAFRDFMKNVLLIDHSSTYKKANHTLDFQIDDNVPEMVSANRDQLEQVLHNIVGNALKYSPDGGDVRLHVSLQDSETLLFTISDQGLGMTPEFLKKFGEKFARAESADIRAIPGTGIGLFLIKKFIEGHGGRIWPHSEGFGKGSTIFFTLPLTPPLPQDPAYYEALEVLLRHCQRLFQAGESLDSAHEHYDDAARADLQRTLQTELEVLRRFVEALTA